MRIETELSYFSAAQAEVTKETVTINFFLFFTRKGLFKHMQIDFFAICIFVILRKRGGKQNKL